MSKSKNILRSKQVIAKTSLSRSSLYALVGRGEFPKQIKLSARSSGWLESEVDQWIEDRISARDNEAA